MGIPSRFPSLFLRLLPHHQGTLTACHGRAMSPVKKKVGALIKTNNLGFSENEVGRCFFLLATGTYFEEVIGILSSPKKLHL